MAREAGRQLRTSDGPEAGVKRGVARTRSEERGPGGLGGAGAMSAVTHMHLGARTRSVRRWACPSPQQCFSSADSKRPLGCVLRPCVEEQKTGNGVRHWATGFLDGGMFVQHTACYVKQWRGHQGWAMRPGSQSLLGEPTKQGTK